MYLASKKTNYIFEELRNSYLIVSLISFFPLLLRITAKNRAKLTKLFTGTIESHIKPTPDSALPAMMLVIF